jgi:hypothetical protein
MTAKKRAEAPEAPKALAPKSAENAEAYAAARAQSATVAASKTRDAHREEYDRYMEAAMAERGYLWEPRPTGKRAALLKMQALAKEFGLGVGDLVEAGLIPIEHGQEVEDDAENDGESATTVAAHAAQYGVVVDPDAR